MIIFIDEFGIHKESGHSIFILVYIIAEHVEILEDKIKEIESGLKIDYFHWADFGSKRGWNTRESFLQQASKLNFEFKVAIIKNPIYFPSALENCLRHLIVEKHIKKIVIDGKKPKWYERHLKKILRDKEISVKKLRTLNDETSPILRLADGLAGLIHSYYDNKTERAERLYNLFTKKITAQLVGGQRTR